MRLARKIVMYLVFAGMLLSVYDEFANYMENGDDFKRDPKIMYEIYDGLPVPDKTEEVEKNEAIRERSSVSLNVYYHTELSIEEVMQFYNSQLTHDGWQKVKNQGGKGLVYKKEKWKISIQEEKNTYRVHIYKFYTY